jgi:hypothetical protein
MKLSYPAALLAAAMFLAGSGAARGAEIIPSLNLTRLEGSEGVRASAGLALRTPLVRRLLDVEVGATYRYDDYEYGAVRVHDWPVTASVWLRPQRNLYVGGGVGWYHTTVENRDHLYADETTQRVGVHVGGGVLLPLSRRCALDFGGRYVFLERDRLELVPTEFDGDSWTTTVGVAVRF